MILDLLAVYRKNASGDALVLDNYSLKEGLYIKLYGYDQKPEVLKIEKKQSYSGELWKFFKTADFYSQLVDMNKPVDPKKKIHSNNMYSVAFKAGTLTEGADGEKQFMDAVIRYYSTLSAPKKDGEKILSSYHIAPIQQKVLLENQEYVLSLTSYLKQQITEYKLKANQYVKLYFHTAIEDYIRENQRYMIPKIFNSNDYNVALSGKIYGLSNSNMGMNAKKPFLEHKTTAFKVPFRINVEDALDTKKVLTWLDGQQDEAGKSVTAGYIPIDSSNIFALEKTNKKRQNAHYLHIEKGKQPIIDEYDFLPGIAENLDPPFLLRNFLLLDDFEEESIRKKARLEQLVDDWFFNKNLIRNYFVKSPKPNDWFSAVQVILLIRYKDAMHNYFRKGEATGLKSCIDSLSQMMLKAMLLQQEYKKLEDTKIAKGLCLRLSLFQYFTIKEKENMGDRLRKISENLRKKLIVDRRDKTTIQDIFCENDEEFYYYAGQVVRYQVSKSQAYLPHYNIIDHVTGAKNVSKFKQEIIKLHQKYNHALGLNNIRYNQLLAAVMGYQCDDQTLNGFDMFLAGLASQNVVYFKDNQEAETDEDEE